MKHEAITPSRIIYADPIRKTSWWSAMAHNNGSWVIFDDSGNVKQRGKSKDQNAAASDAIRWLRKNGKMA